MKASDLIGKRVWVEKLKKRVWMLSAVKSDCQVVIYCFVSASGKEEKGAMKVHTAFAIAFAPYRQYQKYENKLGFENKNILA